MKRLFAVCYTIALLISGLVSVSAKEFESAAQTRVGYYRQPAIHNETIVFVAEGDLWKVGAEGGVAQRLTTHPGLETQPSISPDGRMVAFAGRYEGVNDVFVMPLAGGLPARLTYFGRRAEVAGWSPSGKVLCVTLNYSTLPNRQLIEVDIATRQHELIPLSQAAQGCYDDSEQTLYFTRLPFQGSYVKRYKGGTAQNLWKFSADQPEAIALTADYPGTSANPMWYEGRLYFLSDRDGTMNIWSMDSSGGGLKQHTQHVGWDIQSASLSNGRVVYQLGADIHRYTIADGIDRKLDITLASDFDQMRERWIDEPLDYLTAAHLSPDGEHVVMTARGAVFVVPRKAGRLVEATHESSIRYRSARFMPDGKTVVALNDASGELEFWSMAANGLGAPKQITSDGTVFRFDGIPSPDGKLLAFDDKAQKLWIHDIERGATILVDSSITAEYSGIVWSPDSRYLAFVKGAHNFLGQIFVYDIEGKKTIPVTTDRFLDHDPAWSPDGKWLYFLSDRDFNTIVANVWDLNQPFPLIDQMTKIYMLPLTKGLRSPFEADNELTPKQTEPEADKGRSDSAGGVTIDFDGILERVMETPVPAGNYSSLQVNDEQLYWLSWDNTSRGKRRLNTIEMKNDNAEVKTLAEDVGAFELSADGKRMLIRKDKNLYVTSSQGTSNLDLGKSKLDLSDWAFSINPAHEWRQMFTDAWRMERDYFYDPGMHGVDWAKMHDKYLPLVSRITDRWELSDLLGQMVGEISALHTYVWDGDVRTGPDDIAASFLGAVTTRSEAAGGFKVDYIYRSDPQQPEFLSPLAHPNVGVSIGDVITKVNGVPTMSFTCLEEPLRRMAGKQVLLTVVTPQSRQERNVIVEPISVDEARGLRYRDWEYTRRLEVEDMSYNEIGYVHLRETATSDYGQWVRDFYPVFNRKGLIIDMRHNYGGQIDSWIITTLLRKSWAYWQSRIGVPYSNMQLAFNGHIAVLCNEWTSSDGELFLEGIRRFGLGKIIGTRTWGGEIWLSYNNLLVDKGIASAAESGVYGPEGEWLIEGYGVEPDIVVDNLPHATFEGEDAQLKAAIEYLTEQIRLNPVEVPQAPPYPDKSFDAGQ
ncbi:MAG: S41 family peptidase [Candidatus Zixiibacteriota bacterium]